MKKPAALCIGVVAAVAISAIVAFGAGEGASQKWVALKIAQSETNILTQVDKKLADLASQLTSAIEANMAILADTSNTNRVEQAISNGRVAAGPLVDSLFTLSF
mgnify:CR=1 FL=1